MESLGSDLLHIPSGIAIHQVLLIDANSGVRHLLAKQQSVPDTIWKHFLTLTPTLLNLQPSTFLNLILRLDALRDDGGLWINHSRLLETIIQAVGDQDVEGRRCLLAILEKHLMAAFKSEEDINE